MLELEKKLQGKIYNPNDEEILSLRNKAHALCARFNKIEEDNDINRKLIINELIPHNDNLYLQGPIYFDYGINTHFGKNCYANFNFTVLDICLINIGDNVFFGPNCTLAGANHPLIGEERRMFVKDNVLQDLEYGKEIKIGNDCWICSNVVIIGGVSIGDNVVIAAGSVVTHDIPSNSLAAGNPCKVIRKITKEDSIYLKKELF